MKSANLGGFGRPLGVGLLVIWGLALGGCDSGPDELPEVIRPVRVTRIEDAGAKAQQTLAGVSRASKEMALSFRVSGTIDRLEVKRGQAVEKGDLIATLDTKDASIDVDRALAAQARAKAEHRSALADYERSRLLFAEGSISRAELDASRAGEESSRAMLSAEQKSLELTRSKLGDHRLLAPLPGDIAEVPAEVNENVQSGAPVALLNAGEHIEVEIAVPERTIELFRKGIDASVTFDSIPNEKFAGVVSEVGVASDSAIGGFPVRVKINKVDPRLKAGLAALVNLTLGSDSDAKRIYAPAGAIQEDDKGQRYVMIAQSTEGGFAVVKKVPVVMGEPTGFGMLIESGLTGGELVVTAGLRKITDGAKVRLLPKDQPASAKERLNPDVAKPKSTAPTKKPTTHVNEAPDPLKPTQPAAPEAPEPAPEAETPVP